MKVHDWTLLEAGVFHHFHLTWIAELSLALKKMLPSGYYAMAEQHLGRKQGDVLALHFTRATPLRFCLLPSHLKEGRSPSLRRSPKSIVLSWPHR